MSEKIYKTTVPIYGTSLTLVVTDNVRAYSKQHCADDRNCIAFTAWIKGKLHIVIPRKKNVLGIIAHEAFHAAAEILDHHDSKWSVSNQEPVAYLLGHIVDWVNKVV